MSEQEGMLPIENGVHLYYHISRRRDAKITTGAIG